MINRKAIGYITANYTCRTSSKLTECRPLAALPVWKLPVWQPCAVTM